MTEKQIQHAMKALDISRDEALAMLQEDEAIDRGANPHPLTPEQEKASKAARIVSTGPRTAPVKRERKPNEEKHEIISIIDNVLADTDAVDWLIVTNCERQLDFSYKGTRYRITLSAPRK